MENEQRRQSPTQIGKSETAPARETKQKAVLISDPDPLGHSKTEGAKGVSVGKAKASKKTTGPLKKSTSMSVRQKRMQQYHNQKLGKFAGVFRNINAKKVVHREITAGTLEATIYDKKFLRPGDNLLMEQDLFLVSGGEEVEASSSLFHFIDNGVMAADLLLLMTVLGTCFFTPLTFIWGGKWGTADPLVPGGTFTFFCDFIMDLLYLAHLVILLNMSFMDECKHVEVVERRDIIMNYVKRPSYWIKWLGTSAYFWIALGAPCLINNIKIIRISHLCKLPDSLWQVEEQAPFKMLRPVFLLYIAAHWVACDLACLGGYREQMETDGIASFRTKFDGNNISDWLSAYCMAFIEALYMLTGSLDNPLGDGGPREKNFGGLLIVAIFGPVGCVAAAIFISSIIREQALANVLEMQHAQNKAFLLRALENLAIPKELQRRVFSLHYFQKMSHDYEAFDQLFHSNLSAPVESALRVYLYQESVLSARYFKDKDPNYILEVVRILEDCVFLPGDYVARCGEVGTQMYFVARGELCVLVPHKDRRTEIQFAQEIKRLYKGDYFGDVALLKDCVRTAWVRADCYCILSMLTRTAIENIWKYFPEEREGLIDSVKKRVNEDRKANAKRLWRRANEKAKNCDIGDLPKGLNCEVSAQPTAASQGGLAVNVSGDGTKESDKPEDEEKGASDLEEQHQDDKGRLQAGRSTDEALSCIERVEKACEAMLKGQRTLQSRAEELEKQVATLSEVQVVLTGAVTWASGTFANIEFPDSSGARTYAEVNPEVSTDLSAESVQSPKRAADTKPRKKKVAAKATKNKKLSPNHESNQLSLENATSESESAKRCHSR